ncbi:MAG: Na+/H+ antiporter subunit C [Thalassobium sp.]|jgi:multicomponent K+:H+ antiporter subunit C|uniref:Na+/H+ antiporter subunit C n=1 Tax=Thalassolituus pacificus TaxID=2975440 RepID=A0A9X3ATH2_9GAMM|nr:Na+/H+ antiporter subunit C [Thalassolituus pacificus]MCT7360168.1 Na+/H+ antiporter subunit C [Thalassolituus pacificus]PHS61526.1 MAG: Na+/H+ antiporter subunit C [Thalassobium sp.]
METIYAICVGIMTAGGVFLVLRGYTFAVVLGLTLLSYAVNLFLFASGRLVVNGAAILGESEVYADPLPQALVLTAIVIGFAMTAFALILALRARADLGNDQVDGDND